MATVVESAGGPPAIKTFQNPEVLFHAAAEDFTQRAIDAVNNKGEFTVVLSGGNTPKLFFDALTTIEYCRNKTPWEKIKFFFADERYVPANVPENNYHMAYEYLFSKLPIPPKNIFPISTDVTDPKTAAKQYESTIRKVFHLKDNAFPKFDVVYLGLGEDAHTASLMPFSDPVMSPTVQLVVSLWVSNLNMYRITLTPAAINNSACIIFMVTGDNKSSAVNAVLHGSYEPQKYPAQLIKCANGKIIWYLGARAARPQN